MVRTVMGNVLVADSPKSRIRYNCTKAAGNLNEMASQNFQARFTFVQLNLTTN